MQKIILFYYNVKSKKMFSFQSFLRTDIILLRDLNYKVKLSNRWIDFLCLWKYDIAFLYFYKWSLIPSIIAKLSFKPVFFTGGIDFLDLAYAGRKRFLIQTIFFKLCNLFSTKTIVVSKSDLLNINKIYNNQVPNNIYYLPHTIECKKYFKHLIVEKEKIITTICWMGNKENVLRKGVDKTILIFKEIVKQFPDYKLYIIGPYGAGTSFVNDLISQNNLSDSVVLTGEISENFKIELLTKSKFYFQFSIYEGFGLAILEALASGNIIFHSGKGGLKESVGSDGVCFENLDNIQIIVNKFIDFEKNNLFTNEDLLRQKEHVQVNFNSNIRMDGFKKIFSELNCK